MFLYYLFVICLNQILLLKFDFTVSINSIKLHMSSSLSLTAKESFANYLDYKDDISYEILQKGYDPKTTPKSHELSVIKELHVKNLINYDFYLKQRDIINLVHYDDNSIGCLDFFLYILFIALCISVIIFIWTYFPQVILFDILDKFDL